MSSTSGGTPTARPRSGADLAMVGALATTRPTWARLRRTATTRLVATTTATRRTHKLVNLMRTLRVEIPGAN
eukprot:3331070-Pyramimonas_sp.AAC.1